MLRNLCIVHMCLALLIVARADTAYNHFEKYEYNDRRLGGGGQALL